MTVEQAINFALQNPNEIFGFSLAASAAIILFDIDTGFSFKLPGRGRIGGAAIVAVIGSSIWFLAQGGISSLLGEIAGGIFGGVIIAAVLAFLLSNR